MKSKKQLSRYMGYLIRFLLCIIPVMIALAAVIITYPVYIFCKLFPEILHWRFTKKAVTPNVNEG